MIEIALSFIGTDEREIVPVVMGGDFTAILIDADPEQNPEADATLRVRASGFDATDVGEARKVLAAMLSVLAEGVQPKTESNLVAHAQRELELLGEDPDTIAGLLRVVQAFADMGHSGGSASVAIPMLNDLLQFKNLRPLTNDPAEWIEVGKDMWQSVRNSEAFSGDEGRTYWLLSEGGHANNRAPLHTAVDA